ncbi:MAG: HVA1 family protein [Cyclobacteriaceae bacterium]
MIPKGTKVKWEESDTTYEGMVQESYPEKVELTLEGDHITRHGSPRDQALFIELNDGSKTIRLESEVNKISR